MAVGNDWLGGSPEGGRGPPRARLASKEKISQHNQMIALVISLANFRAHSESASGNLLEWATPPAPGLLSAKTLVGSSALTGGCGVSVELSGISEKPTDSRLLSPKLIVDWFHRWTISG